VAGSPAAAPKPPKLKETHPRPKKWAVYPLASPYNVGKLSLMYRCQNWRLPSIGLGCDEVTNYDVYAALNATGCPRLAFLLTDFDPKDPLDEKLASYKLWVLYAERLEIGGREKLDTWYYGFLVPSLTLLRLTDAAREELQEDAAKGDAGAAARLTVERELARFIEQAEAGFPGLPEIFEQYVETLSLLGRGYGYTIAESDEYPAEKLREWAELGIGRLLADPRGFVKLDIEVTRASQLPEELKRKGEEELMKLLEKLAGLLAFTHFSPTCEFIFAHKL